VGLVFVLGPLGCEIKGSGDDDGGDEASSETTTTETTGGSTTTSGDETAATAASGDGSETTAAPTDCEGSPDYTATAEVLDEGLGPTGAPVTITNCSDAVAYVYQDCCYGAAFQLERKDTADGPWRTSTPSLACDCSGPVDPLVIEPGASTVVETNPASFDSEPICQDPYSAIYRWTFLVGPEPDCEACWQSVPTNEFSWYCEG
jgi:hypothetical protein